MKEGQGGTTGDEREILIKSDGFAYDAKNQNQRLGHVANWQRSFTGSDPATPAVGILGNQDVGPSNR